jgi:hypothetical protein
MMKFWQILMAKLLHIPMRDRMRRHQCGGILAHRDKSMDHLKYFFKLKMFLEFKYYYFLPESPWHAPPLLSPLRQMLLSMMTPGNLNLQFAIDKIVPR